MKRRSSGSSNDVAESSAPETESTDTDNGIRSTIVTSRPSPAKGRLSSSLNWKQSNGRGGGSYSHPANRGDSTRKASSKLPQIPLHLPDSPRMTTSTALPAGSGRLRSYGLWSMSILTLFAATIGIGVLIIIAQTLLSSEIDPKGCRMSYMRPSYVHFSDFDTEHTRFATKYSLYLYRELGIDDEQKVGQVVEETGEFGD